MYSMERTTSSPNKYIPYNERPVSKETLDARRKNGRKIMSELALKGTAVVAGSAVAVGLGVAGYKEMTKVDEHRFDDNKIIAEEVTLQDGAKIREDPNVKTFNSNGYTNELAQLDFGDNSNGIITITPENNVYRIETPNNGDFIGVPVDDIAEAIPSVADKISKDKDGIAWISEQRASVTTPEDAE